MKYQVGEMDRGSAGGATVSRRKVLRALGVSLGLPLLESLHPARSRADEPQPPQRMLVIVNNLGLLPQYFAPEGSGTDYRPSPYLELLAAQREEFTVFSGLSHPDVSGAHSTDNCFLTAAPGAFQAGFSNTISLDQYASERLPRQRVFRH